MRIGIFVVGVGAAGIGILVSSIYVLWYLCSDLVYVILFPQLLCVVYVPHTNTYGSLAAYITGFVFRLSIGEPSLNIPAIISFGPLIPPKTLCMLICLSTILVVSHLAKTLFEKRFLPSDYDVFHCLVNIPTETLPLKESVTTDEIHHQSYQTTTINQSHSTNQEMFHAYRK